MPIELIDNGRDTLDLEFETPAAGVSNCQIEEGIQLYTNENSGKTSLRIPMVIDGVEKGPEGNSGLKISHFCPIETSFGEKQIAAILSIVGLMGACSDKFGSKVDPMSESFINFLKLKMPDRFIKVHHDVRIDNKGKERANIFRFEKLGKKPGLTGPTTNPEAIRKDSAEAASEDW